MKWRLGAVLFVLLGLFGFLVATLYRIQIREGRYYAAKAAVQFRSSGVLLPERGAIYVTDRFGNRIPAAINKTYQVIFAVPKEIQDPARAAEDLGFALNLPKEDLFRILSKKNDTYEMLLPKAPEEAVFAVRRLAIPGVYVDSELFRFYPFQSLAAHVLGFVGPGEDASREGKYGVEAAFEESLRGTPGKIEGDRVVEPEEGTPVVLSIDRNVQATAEELLRELVEKYSATGGTAIVGNPKTGKLSALANVPTFDPNAYSKSPIAAFLNPAVQSIYEPGSIFKVVTMAIGLDRGKFAPETSFIEKGSVTLNGRTISNADGKVYGKVTMREVIEHSINTGAVYAEQRIGHSLFYDTLRSWGIEVPTGIALPGEVGGSMKSLRNGRDVNYATASFGQGVAVTPLRLWSLIAAIANRGVSMRPSILAGDPPAVEERLMSEETARNVADMMASAVRKNVIAQISGYRVAGKTGTAQIPNLEQGGYYEDQFIHSYAGFVPVSDPQVVILLKLDRPKVAALAGLTVVPAFRELAEFALNYYAIPPDDLESASPKTP